MAVYTIQVKLDRQPGEERGRWKSIPGITVGSDTAAFSVLDGLPADNEFKQTALRNGWRVHEKAVK